MIRATTLLCLATIAIGSQAAPAAPQRDVFDQLFARTMAKRETITSIRARFTETTTSSLLRKPIVAHGTVVAAPPAHVLMTYTDPERRLVAIDAKALLVFWPDRGQRERIDISQTQKRIDRYFTRATIDELRAMFDITAAADPGLVNADRVEMRPRRKQIKEGLERLDLWIDRDTLLLVQMEIGFAGGDKKTIRLEDTAVNVPVTDKTFDIPR
jgi:outer membrane lipoprotein-sorting protein